MENIEVPKIEKEKEKIYQNTTDLYNEYRKHDNYSALRLHGLKVIKIKRESDGVIYYDLIKSDDFSDVVVYSAKPNRFKIDIYDYNVKDSRDLAGRPKIVHWFDIDNSNIKNFKIEIISQSEIVKPTY